MALSGFKAQNHPQQVNKRGPRPEVDNLETPWEFFTPLHERFQFTLDAAALPHNTKCERFYAPPDYRHLPCMWRVECPQPCPCPHEQMRPAGVDGLAQDWTGQRVWCNPPYSRIEPWAQKARLGGAELAVLLLPANRVEQGWWQREVEPFRDRVGSPCRVEFLPGRLRFIKHGHDKVEPNQRPPFGCCLLIWGR